MVKGKDDVTITVRIESEQAKKDVDKFIKQVKSGIEEEVKAENEKLKRLRIAQREAANIKPTRLKTKADIDPFIENSKLLENNIKTRVKLMRKARQEIQNLIPKPFDVGTAVRGGYWNRKYAPKAEEDDITKMARVREKTGKIEKQREYFNLEQKGLEEPIDNDVVKALRKIEDLSKSSAKGAEVRGVTGQDPIDIFNKFKRVMSIGATEIEDIFGSFQTVNKNIMEIKAFRPTSEIKEKVSDKDTKTKDQSYINRINDQMKHEQELRKDDQLYWQGRVKQGLTGTGLSAGKDAPISIWDKLKAKITGAIEVEQKKAEESEKGVGIQQKMRRAITGVLIDLHLLRIMGQSSVIVSTMFNLVSKSIGVVVDMIMIEFLPTVIALTRWFYELAFAFKRLDPVTKTLLGGAIAVTAFVVLFTTILGGVVGSFLKLIAVTEWLTKSKLGEAMAINGLTTSTVLATMAMYALAGIVFALVALVGFKAAKARTEAKAEDKWKSDVGVLAMSIAGGPMLAPFLTGAYGIGVAGGANKDKALLAEATKSRKVQEQNLPWTKTFTGFIYGIIVNVLKTLYDWYKWLKGIYDWIMKQLKDIYDKLIAFIQPILDFFADLGELGGKIAAAIVKWVIDSLKNVGTLATDIWNAIVNWFVTSLKDTIDTGKALWDLFWNWVKGGCKDPIGFAKEAWTIIKDWMLRELAGVINLVIELSAAFIRWFERQLGINTTLGKQIESAIIDWIRKVPGFGNTAAAILEKAGYGGGTTEAGTTVTEPGKTPPMTGGTFTTPAETYNPSTPARSYKTALNKVTESKPSQKAIDAYEAWMHGTEGGKPFPTAQTGGTITQTGLAVVHKGETVTPSGKGSINNFEVKVDVKLTDIQALSDKISREIWDEMRRKRMVI